MLLPCISLSLKLEVMTEGERKVEQPAIPFFFIPFSFISNLKLERVDEMCM